MKLSDLVPLWLSFKCFLPLSHKDTKKAQRKNSKSAIYTVGLCLYLITQLQPPERFFIEQVNNLSVSFAPLNQFIIPTHS